MMQKKILFVGHEASRTGAPLVLLHIMDWLKRNTTYDMELLLLRGGPLEDSYRQLAKTSVWTYSEKKSALRSLLGTVKRLWIRLRLKYGRHDLVYLNSFSSIAIVNRLHSILPQKAILHVHELAYVLNEIQNTNRFTNFDSFISSYICCSEACRNHFESHFQIQSSKTHLIYEFVPQAEASILNPTKSVSDAGNDAFVVGSSGTIDWRKGTDFFIYLGAKIKKDYPDLNIQFVWVGGGRDKMEIDRINSELEKTGLKNEILFTGQIPNPHFYFQQFDVFVLTSREDPFPLVCIEAALLKKPILCFAESGGMVEFVRHETGFIIPYSDVDEMAKKIVELYSNPGQKERLGENAYRRAHELHTVDNSMPAVLKVIETTLYSS